MIGGFRHTGIAVRDMDASLAFYRDVLGLTLVSDRVSAVAGEAVGAPGASARICVLAVPDSTAQLELLEYRGARTHPVAPQPVDPGAAHASFWVSDIAALYARLQAHGVRTLSAPRAQTSGRLKLYACDPDGFWLELTEGSGPSTSSG
jgi:catechol 2,3-dioxygenase-like lactoylglutathione lyase family enzyme